jgi:hypothetical protein
MLDTAPQGEPRALFDSLQLDVLYQPDSSAVEIAVALYRGGNYPARRRAKDWLAHLASHSANLESMIEGPAISPAARHTKVPHNEYRQ